MTDRQGPAGLPPDRGTQRVRSTAPEAAAAIWRICAADLAGFNYR